MEKIVITSLREKIEEDRKRKIEEEFAMYEEEQRYNTMRNVVVDVFLNGKSVAGHCFDSMRGVGETRMTLSDGSVIKDGPYTFLISDAAICIIETGRVIGARTIEILHKNQLSNFKKLFPEYATDRKIYVYFAGFDIEEKAQKLAKQLGFGVIRQIGDAVEIDDENLKAY